ncbi:MAG: hypothetical protein C6W58_14570 [Bacillaceae bacterium]|uniref:Acetyltransferase n=1 Tax=Aeribacillus composti TaxID=1868734 RepID=A0ABY9WGA3_9BACI|nr:hypothetical protein [Aeribacillus composti]REJ13438.1 MAG: hypothetical protein C6W58_14570 [Bacillaceae bacterium]WNF34993.1 hypothetical protein RI196_07825 [Aeribacillus composti]
METDMGTPQGGPLSLRVQLSVADSVIRLVKEKFKRENGGRLFCEICGFDFYEVYGEIGEDFIEVFFAK